VFEDLNYEELRRRANECLPERVIAMLKAHGETRGVTAGETLFRTDDRHYPFHNAAVTFSGIELAHRIRKR
jgi:hypothetical protein